LSLFTHSSLAAAGCKLGRTNDHLCITQLVTFISTILSAMILQHFWLHAAKLKAGAK
jgi:hypothetical protein